jgi:fumarate hydratase class II
MAKKAHTEKLTLREGATSLIYLSEEEHDRLIDAKIMIRNERKD